MSRNTKQVHIGKGSKPDLLVDVLNEYSPTHFEFWVVNGGWHGAYDNGAITVEYTGTRIEGFSILPNKN
jgi:hypothetical protein